MPDDGLNDLLERLKAIRVEQPVARNNDDEIVSPLERLRSLISRPMFFRQGK